MARKPLRTSSWSSTSSTRIIAGASGTGTRAAHQVPAAGSRADLEASARMRQPAPACRAVPARPGCAATRRRRCSRPRARSRRRGSAAARRPRAPGPACLRALVSASCAMRYRFRLTAGGSGRGLADDVQAGRDARAASTAATSAGSASTPIAEPVGAIVRPAPDVRGAWSASGAARRRRCARCPRLQAGQARRRIRVAVERRAGGAGLHAHHRDVVRHRIVQLAGDAHPVERDRLIGDPCALAARARRCAARAASRARHAAQARSPK